MHASSDFAGIIWVAVLLIGFIANSVKRAQARRPVDPKAAAAAAQAASQAAAQRTAAIAEQRARLAQAAAQVAPPVATVRPAPPVRPAPVRSVAPPSREARPNPVVTYAVADPFASAGMTFEAPAPPPPIVHDRDMGLPTGVPKRFFENRQSLIWGVVMSEVLGRPKALAVEQNLWSPQHQPPSI